MKLSLERCLALEVLPERPGDALVAPATLGLVADVRARRTAAPSAPVPR